MTALYNESDPFAACWLRRLIEAGKIAPGRVDSRPIQTLSASELDGYTQVHLFAGIGGWSLALRLAGWPDDRPVWTGSCPCQPFSAAGARKGVDDERHLWPVMAGLIREHRPNVVFGEQVSSKDGLAWFDAVSTDLEDAGYAVGALDTCAASVGAPHRRQRLFFVGHADRDAAWEHARELPRDEGQHGERRADGSDGSQSSGGASGLADADGSRQDELREAWLHGEGPSGIDLARRGEDGHWAGCDWALCDDPGGPRWRPIEPGSFPLADGVPDRVGRLSGYGNAIVPQVAAEFIGSYLEVAS